jgi:hypothetical protein
VRERASVCVSVCIHTCVRIGNTTEAREGTRKLARDPGMDFFDTEQNSKTKMLLYMRVGCILVIFVVDAIGFLVLQLLRRRDFVCTEEPPGRHVHAGNLGFLIVIHLMHAIYILDVVFGQTLFARRETSICWQVCVLLWSQCTTRFTQLYIVPTGRRPITGRSVHCYEVKFTTIFPSHSS